MNRNSCVMTTEGSVEKAWMASITKESGGSQSSIAVDDDDSTFFVLCAALRPQAVIGKTCGQTLLVDECLSESSTGGSDVWIYPVREFEESLSYWNWSRM